MDKPFGSNVSSVLAQADFVNVASAAFDSGQTVPQMLIEACRRYGDRPAATHLDCTLSYAEIDRQSADFAAWLRHGIGLEAGDRVAIMLPNLLQYPVALLGVLRADLVAVLANPMYTPRELRHQLADSGARALLVLDNFGAVAAEAVQGTAVEHVITTRVGDMLSWPKSMIVDFTLKYVKKMIPPFRIADSVRWPKALAEGARLPRVEAKAGPEDTVQLQYTSATTGVAKGAVLAHRAVIANVASAEQCFGRTLDPARDTVMICLPIYHIAAYSNLIFNMAHGFHTVLISNPRDIPVLVSTFAKVRPAFFSGVNTLYDAILNDPSFAKLDFSNLRLCLQGGTALRRATAERWKALTGCPVVEGYGLSETSAAITYNRPDGANPVGSIGLALGEVEISLRDENGEVVAVGETGELCARGPHMTTGYWNQPEETGKAFFDGGWFRTGDIARVDEQGYYYILDRRKDMILVSGFNVYPNEIEDVVAMLPGVLEAAAVGIPDEKCGEAVRLVVVRSDPSLTEETLRAHCRKNLAGYKQPRVVEFRDSLPKSAVGKILRRELR
ncbi:MAG: AMP-binding protein [Dokdonella sp.]